MINFIGTYEYKVDEKGRFPVHKMFRDELHPKESVFAMVPWVGGCLAMFPLADMKEFQARFRGDQSLASREARLFQLKVMAGASVVEPDAQGRVTLNQAQLAHAGLDKGVSVTLVGHFNRIEVWRSDRLKQELENVNETDFERFAQIYFQPSANGTTA